MTPAHSLRSWWRSKTRGEQYLVSALLASVIAVVVWIGLWAPLARQVAVGTVQRTLAERDLAQARADVEETTRLARAPLPPPIDARNQLEESLRRTSLRSAIAQLDWQPDGRVRLTFGSVEFARLVSWLETLQRQAGLHVQEATMSALVQPGLIRAELTLAK